MPLRKIPFWKSWLNAEHITTTSQKTALYKMARSLLRAWYSAPQHPGTMVRLLGWFLCWVAWKDGRPETDPVTLHFSHLGHLGMVRWSSKSAKGEWGNFLLIPTKIQKTAVVQNLKAIYLMAVLVPFLNWINPPTGSNWSIRWSQSDCSAIARHW